MPLLPEPNFYLPSGNEDVADCLARPKDVVPVLLFIRCRLTVLLEVCAWGTERYKCVVERRSLFKNKKTVYTPGSVELSFSLSEISIKRNG